MSKQVVRLLVVGAVVIASVRLFRFQEKLSDNVVGRVKTRDPEQLVVAAALTVGLGLVAVVAAQALRKAA